jgi:regulator of nucleoside diphosphate kinase
MPSKAKYATRPSIILGETDADRLFDLAEQAELHTPSGSHGLLGELMRAHVRPDARVPATVIGMNSTVDFVDDAHGATRTVQLVYPAQADIAKARISIMTPIGAGLIGLAEGQSIAWPDREGKVRLLRVLKVRRP